MFGVSLHPSKERRNAVSQPLVHEELEHPDTHMHGQNYTGSPALP